MATRTGSGDLQRANRALRTHAALSREIARAEDEASLLQATCRVAVEVGGYGCAWIGRAESDPGRSVRLVAAVGAGAEELRGIDVRWSGGPPGRGVTGQAIRTRAPAVHRAGRRRGPESPPTFAERWGFEVAASLPLIVDDQVYGALTLYAAEKEAFDAVELEPLCDLAASAAQATSQLRARLAQARAEAALRESERRLRLILDATRTMFVLLDPDGTLRAVNATALAPIGLTEAEVLGKPMWAARHEDPHADLLQDAIGRVVRDKAPVEFEGPGDFPLAPGRTLDIRFAPLLDEVGEVLGVVGEASDVTGRRNVERALAQSEALLAGVLANVEDVVYSYDQAAERFLYLSPSAERVFGRPMTWYLGGHFIEGVHPDDLHVYREARARLREGDAVDHDIRVLRPSGELRWLRHRAHGVRDANGKVERFDGILSDFTERRQAEAAARETLERRVAERTAELREANAQLAAASRAKDQFLAAMSHELRTPLNGVLGLTEALLEDVYGPLADRQRAALGRIDESGRHLLDVIGDILDLAKLDGHDLPIDPEDVPVEDACRASLRLVQAVVERKRQSATLLLAAPGMTVRADPRRLKQMLVNLLRNAVRFTPEGGALGLSSGVEEGGAAVRLTVWDHGIGIEARDLARLTLPFVQVDASLSRRHGGAGLGLPLVRRLCELHGGRLVIESAPQQGSRFSLILPAGRAASG
jgi:PAS domain S-box-containing protein